MIIGVLFFELIIFIHEFGHFIAAKKCGVKVNEFSLGMGKRLFGFKKGETEFNFRLIPIGGYCAMEGEDEVGGNPGRKTRSDNADSESPCAEPQNEEEDSAPSNDPRSFNNAKIWKRMVIIIAGAVMNILLGFVLMFVTLIPKDEFAGTTISQPQSISFSSITGLQPGDQLLKIDGYDINTYTDLSFALYTLDAVPVDGSELAIYKEDCLFDLFSYARDHQDQITTTQIADSINSLLTVMQPELRDAADKQAAYQVFCQYYDKISEVLSVEVTEYPAVTYIENRMRFRTDMTVLRDGERVELKDVDFLTTKATADGDPQMNIDFYVLPVDKNFGSMITQTFAETGSNIRMVWGSLAGIVTGKFGINEMSGPIGIASAITTVASESLAASGFGSAVMSIIYVMMIITVNLGIINMLPFPALDGGRFLMLLIEAIFKKPVPQKAERIINTVGLVLLLGLSAFIAVKDVIQLFA